MRRKKKPLVQPWPLKNINEYHLMVQKPVLDSLDVEEGIKGVMGRCTLYIFPPGTAFDPNTPPTAHGKELIEIKFRSLTSLEKKQTAKGYKNWKDQQRGKAKH